MGGEKTKFVIVDLQWVEFRDNPRYSVSTECTSRFMVKRTIRFPAVWEALKNNMSKLRAMRIKRRESGYWGLISVRFSRMGRVKPFSNGGKKKKKKNNAFGFTNFIGTNDESRVEIARLVSVILLSILFRTWLKLMSACMESIRTVNHPE